MTKEKTPTLIFCNSTKAMQIRSYYSRICITLDKIKAEFDEKYLPIDEMVLFSFLQIRVEEREVENRRTLAVGVELNRTIERFYLLPDEAERHERELICEKYDNKDLDDAIYAFNEIKAKVKTLYVIPDAADFSELSDHIDTKYICLQEDGVKVIPEKFNKYVSDQTEIYADEKGEVIIRLVDECVLKLNELAAHMDMPWCVLNLFDCDGKEVFAVDRVNYNKI